MLASFTAWPRTESHLTEVHAWGSPRKVFAHNTLTRLLAPYLTHP